MAFVNIGSNQNNCTLVQCIAQCLMQEAGSLRKAEALSTELHENEALVTHEYSFIPKEAGTCFTESEGPSCHQQEDWAHHSPAIDVASQILHSLLVANYNQPWFANPTESRDGEAAHIVPVSRPEIFNKITSGHSDQYLMRAAVLLDP
ncbi:hypothetical protein JCM1840_001761, partial [Sporobolomyces johnsonii]